MKVSVCMTAYNQEKYIAEAVESVLMQQTTFAYELVIGDDYSTDRTRQIILDYQKKYPDKIHLILQESNVGSRTNGIQTLKACQGQYIANLDGDDYWTSPHKLQKQADFLDSHPECAICFHNARRIDEEHNQELELYCREDQKEISTIEDILLLNVIPSCAMMFRNGLFGDYPAWHSTLPLGDWLLIILNAQHGQIGYINEVMGVYRLHNQGIFGKVDKIQRLQQVIKFSEDINVHLNYKYNATLKIALSKWYYELAREYEKNRDPTQARNATVKSLVNSPFNSEVPTSELLKILPRVSLPRVYQLLQSVFKFVFIKGQRQV